MGRTPPQHEEARGEAFGYICRACSRCCQHKVIQVNPYEIARLARRTGQTTGEFRAKCTEDGAGSILRRNESDTCIFIGAEGCTVHPDRPLVCRLYPLGRRVSADGTERWLHVTPHPQSEGEYSKNGTIADFIAKQGAIPYMRAADEYSDWVREAYALIEAEGETASGTGDGTPKDLLDMDTAITMHCAEAGTAEPSDIEDRKCLHLEILYRQLNRLKGGEDDYENADERR